MHTDVYFNPYLSIGGEVKLPMLRYGDHMSKAVENNNMKPTNKRSKWGEEYQKTFNPPPFHFIPHTLSADELEYIIRLYRLDEVTKKIYMGDFAPADKDLRSPSPPPIYDKAGHRVNTRNQRYREFVVRE